jgi:hypothetical protein
VFIGDTITARVECSEKLEPRKWVKFKTTVTNQDGKLVVDGAATVIPPLAYPMRRSGGPAIGTARYLLRTGRCCSEVPHRGLGKPSGCRRRKPIAGVRFPGEQPDPVVEPSHSGKPAQSAELCRAANNGHALTGPQAPTQRLAQDGEGPAFAHSSHVATAASKLSGIRQGK